VKGGWYGPDVGLNCRPEVKLMRSMLLSIRLCLISSVGWAQTAAWGDRVA